MFIRKKKVKGHIYYSLETRYKEDEKVKSGCIGSLGKNPYTGLKNLLEQKKISQDTYSYFYTKLRQMGIEDTLKLGYFIPIEDLEKLFNQEFSTWLKQNYQPIKLDLLRKEE